MKNQPRVTTIPRAEAPCRARGPCAVLPRLDPPRRRRGRRWTPPRRAWPPFDRDLYALSDEDIRAHGGRRLPRNLLEATEILKGDPLAAEVLGPVMLDSFLRYKVDEWERYHQTVTDWEVNEYLRLY